jgi:hypothetical protein
MKTLENTVAGDKLAIRGPWNRFYISTVERTTATLVFISGYRFNRSGFVVGETGYAKTLASPATDADRLKVRILNATHKLDKFIVTEENVEAVELLLRMMTIPPENKEPKCPAQ